MIAITSPVRTAIRTGRRVLRRGGRSSGRCSRYKAQPAGIRIIRGFLPPDFRQ